MSGRRREGHLTGRRRSGGPGRSRSFGRSSIEPYAARWSISVAIEDATQLGAIGQARNRLSRAVERTVPFELAVNTHAISWCATASHHPGDVNAVRALARRTGNRFSRLPSICSPSSVS